MLTRRWQPRTDSLPVAALQELCATLHVTPLTARALFGRGVQSAEDGSAFFANRLATLPDPLLLPGMAAAVERLAAAVTGGEKIAVHGDYDVDGITGTALLVETLRAFGAEVSYHIPLRLRDGYGLSAEAIRASAEAGVRLLVTVDCGISAMAEASLAAALGLDLIITDHHQPPPLLPPAVAIVNPALPDHLFPCRELAGVGVAFFLLVALRQRLRQQGAFRQRPEPDLRRSLDLVALGTIADMVPLQGVNRLLARFGLGVLSGQQRPGIAALKKVAAVADPVNCGAVAFRLAPRLNAAGRLEDANLGVELLLTSDPGRAGEIAELLDGFNRERQQLGNLPG
ncbi:MAG: DHH family phosphoesterase, partial [Desulfuromonadales bacterium]|nr:DHH family phosphoesterase [Desulfuromonadales bacterium]